ncbi:MAG: IPT/TIG domain-containing protein [Planctomycetaceae bacterium]|nr:IPT/TIG domain-containing protein [Planctomycetaceae bacterium]
MFGQNVVIYGSGFVNGATVLFGSEAAIGVSVSVDGTQILCSAPEVTDSQYVDVTVTNPDTAFDTLENGFGYEPVITSVDPSSGPDSGGTPLEISGGGFNSNCELRIDNVEPASPVRVDSETMTCVTNSHAAGQVNVRVFNPFVSLPDLSFTLTNGFTYEGAESSISFSSASAPPESSGSGPSASSGPSESSEPVSGSDSASDEPFSLSESSVVSSEPLDATCEPDKDDCCGCQTCCDSQNPSSIDRFSERPIRYATGEMRVVVSDLSSSGFGDSWGHTRSYRNRMSQNIDYGNGFNWLVQQWPYLYQPDAEHLTIVRAGTASEFFEWDGFDWVGMYGIRETLTSSYQLRSASGIIEDYEPLDSANAYRGRLLARTAPGDQTTTCNYDTGSGLLQSAVRSAPTLGLEEQYTYEYTGTSLTTVTIQRNVESAGWTPVRRAVYTYYGESDDHGLPGDLRTVEIQTPATGSSSSVDWGTESKSYYRYYKGESSEAGFAHALKLVVGPEAFRRLEAAASDPFEASDALVAQFADQYFEYDDEQRVTREVVDAGTYGYDFTYEENAAFDANDPNSWMMKTTETLPDGTQNIVWANGVTQVLLKEVRSEGGSQRWMEYQQFNADYNLILRAAPSAVDMEATASASSSGGELHVNLKPNSGLIHSYGYYDGTDGPRTYLKFEAIQNGELGPGILQRFLVWNYYGSLVKLQSETVYREEVEWDVSDSSSGSAGDGGPITTSYNYYVDPTTLQVLAKHTILPAVPSEQNGSGVSAVRRELFDQFGNQTWEQGPRGFVSKFTYDVTTGAMIQRIDDVDPNLEGLEWDPIDNAYWTIPDGDRLNVVTDYTVDDEGRTTQELGPSHVAVVDGEAVTVRTARWNVYLDDEHETRSAQGFVVIATDQSSSATGSGSEMSVDSGEIIETVLVNPVQITKSDDLWRPVDQISAVRASTVGPLEPTDTFPQSTWVRWTRQAYDDASHLVSSRAYHTIPVSGEGTEGTNYDETLYGYDERDRQNRVRSPGGTITRTVYDVLSRSIATWVGTDDEGATNDDPSGASSSGSANSGNNMVVVTESAYDEGQDGGDSNLTQVIQHVDDTTVRVTNYEYDWRNRQEFIDGEEDFFQQSIYDNLDRPVEVRRYDTDLEGDLVAKSTTAYDDRGRTYRTRRYSVSGGVAGNYLEDNFWFDAAENQIKSLPAGAHTFTKSLYDGLRRRTASYVGFYDPALGSSSSDNSGSSDSGDPQPGGEPYSEVGIITERNKIFEQTVVTYDDASDVLATAFYQRWHDAIGGGPLQLPTAAQPKARVSYQAQWYDGVGRSLASANYGTNDNAAFTRPAEVPARSDDVLVTTTGYDDAGRTFQTIDPADKETRREFDALDRVVRSIDNYVESSSTATSSSGFGGDDENLTVETTYTPDGQTATLTAVNAATGDQVTRYFYGTTLDDSDVARSDLLRKVIYPDSDDTSASGTSSAEGSDEVYDRVEYRYNRQSQQTEFKDQNETVHNYDYDGLGRRTADKVTLPPGSAIDDAVLRIATTYEVRGMPEKITSHDAATSGSVVNEVQRAYNGFGQLIAEYQSHAGAVNTMTTPRVQYAYDDGADNTARPTTLVYPNGRELFYHYGTASSDDDRLSRVFALQGEATSSSANETYVEYTYVGLSSFVRVNYPEPQIHWDLITGSDPNPYAGWDRFGRVIYCLWYDNGASQEVESLLYGYDRASNRIWRQNTVAPPGNDELYAYDGAQRLIDMQRGTLTNDDTQIAEQTFAQQWNLDATGNWQGFREAVSVSSSGSDSWSLEQTRAANPANEITGIIGGGWVTPAYDRAGNMVQMPQPNAPTDGYEATCDAWNRLVKLEEGSATIAIYAYDGLTRRITANYGSDVRNTYFSVQWQALEERLDSLDDAERQFIWGLRYIDDLVLRDRPFHERLFALQDANWNVTAIVNSAGSPVERYCFSPYGSPEFMDGEFNMIPFSEWHWEILYASYKFDKASGFQFARYRYINPAVGEWMTRDPVEYLDGLSLYQYVNSQPVSTQDFDGTIAIDFLPDADGNITTAVQFPRVPLPNLTPPRHIFKESAWLWRKTVLQNYKYFSQWYEEQVRMGVSWVAKLPPCPCRLKKCSTTQSLKLFSSTSSPGIEFVNPDPSKWSDWGYKWFISNSLLGFHPGGVYELRSSANATVNGTGQQCVYDKDGILITRPPAAGTADFGSPEASGRHFEADVTPFNTALSLDKSMRYGTTFESLYYIVRPINGGQPCKA